MSAPKPVELAWLAAPRPGLMEGLITSGLVPKNQQFVTPEKPNQNLKSPKREEHHEKTTKLAGRQISTAQTKRRESTLQIKHEPNEITTSRSQNPAKVKSLFTSIRPQTGLGVSSRIKPDSENPLPPITDLISTQRKVPASREIQSLSNQYHQLIDGIQLNIELPPADQANQILETSQNVFLIWNKANSLIRSYSEEHTVLFVKIKKFFQSRLELIPQLFEHYEKRFVELSDLESKTRKENEELTRALKEAERSLEQNTAFNMRLSEELEGRNTQVADLKSALETAEYNRDAAISDNNTMAVRMQKNEEQKNQAKQLLADAHMKIDELEGLLEMANDKIKVLEKSGDELLPRFAELERENEKIKKENESLKSDVKQYLVEPQYVDFNQITDMPEENTNRRRKKGKKDPHKMTMTSSSNFKLNASAMSMQQSSTNLTDTQTSIFDQTESLKQKNKKPRPKSPLKSGTQNYFRKGLGDDIPDDASTITNFEGSTKLDDDVEEKSEQENTNLLDEASSILEKTEQTARSEHKSEGEPAKPPKTQLPADYTIDNDQPLDTTTMINYVNRLLPLPLGTSLYSVPDLNQPETKGISEPKPFFWVARHIISFFQTMTNTDNAGSLDTDCKSIVRQQIIEKGGTPYVGKKIFQELMSSTQFYMHSSPLVQFFLKFINNELNIIDLIFFKILFNASFTFIYPSISNLDLTSDSTQFLIHLKMARRLQQAFFPHLDQSAIDERHLREATTKSPCVDLVDFWAFAQQMIMFFRQTHTRFHRQVSALLSLVGWTGINTMTQAVFSQFFTIIQPNITDEELENLWKRYSLEQLEREAQGTVNNSMIGLGRNSSSYFSLGEGGGGDDVFNEQEQTKIGFIQFCSDWPEISSNILKLFYNENLESQLTNLPQPLLMLIKYMRSRFTHFLRDINKKLPPENRAIGEKPRTAFRNALVRCDIGDAISCYRRYLQVLDLKLVEQRPYIQLMQNVSENEIKAVRDMLFSRENLVCTEIGLAVDPIED